MEFKPSPFSFLFSPFIVQSLWLFLIFHFLSSCLWWGCFPHMLPRSSLSPSSLHMQKWLPDLRGRSLPKFTSLCCVPAGFCGSGCADFCVNPQISFLGVYDGLNVNLAIFHGCEMQKDFHAVLPS